MTEEQLNLWYEELPNKEQKEIRDAYEEMLLEHWYAKFLLSEVSDWWDNRIRERYRNI